MDLIDRYLHAVRDYLPAKSQDDIVRELGDDIRAQAADREEELGRPLTADDQAALLKRFGHPMLLASKYRPTQHLISPALFPFYVTGLKISIGIALLVQAALAIAMAASGQPGAEVIGRLASFPFNGLVTLFGWITIGFALVDLHVRQITTRATAAWDPRTLTEPTRRPAGKRPWELALDLVLSTVFLLWWLAIPRAPWLIFGPAASFLATAPAFDAIHLPVAVAWLVGLFARWTLAFRPNLGDLRFWFDVGSNIFTMFVAAYLLRADAIVVRAPGLHPSGMTAEQLVRIVEGVDAVARIAMVVVMGVAAWEIGRALWKRLRT
jgi:hypothetical protein